MNAWTSLSFDHFELKMWGNELERRDFIYNVKKKKFEK